ncbi:uncharacterized protein LOC105931876 isoform X1 [Fundulus heteroclitus]|uniref:uncharacterized protein LOC105931876 isoform X1 n=1 Tax=Fundulus heteroclitus TaxID=8078 RepID=UPI00165BDD6F|nr:uncharacterized protein LOC105931876 isoform X1 [Fundulus heteroclitus]
MLHDFQARWRQGVDKQQDRRLKMGPQLYSTMYKEHFRSPGVAKKAELRPTSANRRNNPQPRPDFLFPHSLRPSYRPTRTMPRPLPPVDNGRPLFPPVNRSLPLNPVSACPENPLGQKNSDSPQHMPPISDRAQKLQLIETPAANDGQLPTSLRSPNKTADNQRNVNPLSARQLRPQAGSQFQARPQTSNPSAAAALHCFTRTPYRKCCSTRAKDFSDCYSCFHVVRPYQASHYVIHPEFVSESLY